MENKGIMAEIRRKLSEGMTTDELIAEGYKVGSIGKARWQLRRFQETLGMTASIGMIHGTLTKHISEEGEEMWLWHPKPPIPCPSCGQSVGHWNVCPECNVFVPEGCACPLESLSNLQGYTLQQLEGVGNLS